MAPHLACGLCSVLRYDAGDPAGDVLTEPPAHGQPVHLAEPTLHGSRHPNEGPARFGEVVEDRPHVAVVPDVHEDVLRFGGAAPREVDDAPFPQCSSRHPHDL